MDMTIEEKRDRIREWCATSTCKGCPLYHNKDLYCYGSGADIERNYSILFGKKSEPEPSANPDNVNHPKHYGSGKFECIDVMVETQGVEAVKAFCLCNALKYLYRHNNKNGVEDIKKARWYLDKYLELEGNENG
jgi:hypothetical protein